MTNTVQSTEPVKQNVQSKNSPSKNTTNCVTNRAPTRREKLLQLQSKIGNQAMIQFLEGSNLHNSEITTSKNIHEIAAAGVQGTGHKLPYYDRIQASFGDHDLSNVQAYTNSAAAKANADMGARAYATGNKIAFAGTPSLHTAAHEVAHIIQQRSGIQLKNMVGKKDDMYERQANAVADLIMQERPVGRLLNVTNAYNSKCQASIFPVQLLPDWTTSRGHNKVKANIESINNENYMVGFELPILKELSGDVETLPDAPVSWKTQVTWSTLSGKPTYDINAKPEGNHMIAMKLGPDHPKGCGPSDDTRINSNILTQKLGIVYIAGHMLNDNLGGTGESPLNIIAIPKTLNTTYEKAVEKGVKDQVNTYGRWVYYEVMVTKRDTTGRVNKFIAKWHNLGVDGNSLGEIYEYKIDVDTQVINGAEYNAQKHNDKINDKIKNESVLPATSIVSLMNKQEMPLTNSVNDYDQNVPINDLQSFPFNFHAFQEKKAIEKDKIPGQNTALKRKAGDAFNNLTDSGTTFVSGENLMTEVPHRGPAKVYKKGKNKTQLRQDERNAKSVKFFTQAQDKGTLDSITFGLFALECILADVNNMSQDRVNYKLPMQALSKQAEDILKNIEKKEGKFKHQKANNLNDEISAFTKKDE
jgi:hypothetical protein